MGTYCIYILTLFTLRLFVCVNYVFIKYVSFNFVCVYMYGQIFFVIQTE